MNTLKVNQRINRIKYKGSRFYLKKEFKKQRTYYKTIFEPCLPFIKRHHQTNGKGVYFLPSNYYYYY